MKIKWFAFLLLAGWLAGCATNKPGLYSYEDQFNGDKFELITDNFLDAVAQPGTRVWLNASRITQRTGVVLYYLEVHYESASEWINVQPGETLALNIDGQERRYSGLGSVNTRKKSGGKFVEDAAYKATAGDIRDIASARGVQVKIMGANATVDRKFQAQNLQRYSEFVATCLDVKK